MILCVCRRISDRHVHEARQQGATSPGQVFRHQGCAPQCGSCVPLIRAMIRDAVACPLAATATLAAAE